MCVCGDGACLPLCPVSVATHCWEPTSQTLVLSSEEAVASKHPSREKQHHRTAPSCPCSSPGREQREEEVGRKQKLSCKTTET